MTELREPQIFRPIQEAIRPLLADGDFRLETIKYFYYDSVFHIRLSSQIIDISFIFAHWGGGRGTVNCAFVERENQLYLGAGSLFSVFNIAIQVTDDHIIFAEDLPENTDSLQELSRISTEIKKHLPEILDLFRPERIEETVRLSLAESKKYHEIKAQEWREREATKFPNFRESLPPLFGFLYPLLRKLEPRYPKHVEGYFWKQNLSTFEEVIAIIRKNFHPRDIDITYHGDRDTFDIDTGFTDGNRGLGFIINQELDNTVEVYFRIGPEAKFPFIKDRINMVKQQKMIFFPGKNVFQLLGVPHSSTPKGYLADLQELCRLVRDNFPALSDVFSVEKKQGFSETNIERTYNVLMAMEGNNDEEIQALFRHYFEVYFDVKNRPVRLVNGKIEDPFGVEDEERTK